MANKSTNNDAKNDKKGSSKQTVIVVAALVATVLLVVILQRVFRLDDTTTALVGTLVIAAVVFGVTYLLIIVRRRSITRDRRKTCEPILRRFRLSHNPSQLMAEYHQWCTHYHEPKLVYDFTGNVVDALIEGGNYTYARNLLKDMAKMPTTDRTRMEFEKFRSERTEYMKNNRS